MKFFEIHQGVTRTVFLVGRKAYKIPTLRHGWRGFLKGLLSNMQEGRFSELSHLFDICPLDYYVPGGWLNVMPRLRTSTQEEYNRWYSKRDISRLLYDCDLKPDNLAWLVLIDYGHFF